MFGQWPERGAWRGAGVGVVPGAAAVLGAVLERGAAGLLGDVVFEPAVPAAAPAPAAITAVLPSSKITYLRLRIDVLPCLWRSGERSQGRCNRA
jgi:hypothetical protein